MAVPIYEITEAVQSQIRQAQARYTNFELGLPNPLDHTATDYFKEILLQLEEEIDRVRGAMVEMDTAVTQGREKNAIVRDLMLS